MAATRQQYYILEISILCVLVFLNQPDHNKCDGTADFRLSLGEETIETFRITNTKIFHLAADRFVPGNILFSDQFSLQTTDGNVTHMIVGSTTNGDSGYQEGNGTAARFRGLRGFLQLNETAVIVVDHGNHCLRLVDRLTNQTSVYAGNCTNSNFRNGNALSKALFSRPQKIIFDSFDPKILLIVSAGSNFIRKLNTASNYVGTFGQALPQKPWGIVQDNLTGNFFVSTQNMVYRVFRNGEFEKAAGYEAEDVTPRGWFDGPLNKTLFYQPVEMILISNRTMLLVADEHNQRIRVLDLITNTSSSIGSGFPADDDGLLDNCTLFEPVSLMVVNDIIYVGTRRRIRAIKGSNSQTTEKPAATPQPCTGTEVDIILIASGVGIVTVSIAIVIGVLYHKIKMRVNSTNMSWNNLRDDAINDEATSAPENTAQGQNKVAGYENVANTSVSSNGINNDGGAEYEGLEKRTSHVYTSPKYWIK